MADVSLAFDPSSSMSKALYTLKPFRVEWLAMEPEVIEVSKAALEQYEGNALGTTALENQAWLEVGGRCYAAGYLARSRFYADAALRELKSERAAYKVVAMVGAIAAKKRLPPGFSLELGVLLPYGEYQDRKQLEPRLEKELAEFSFRGQRYQVKLERFHCVPEGTGLALRGLGGDKDLEDTSVLVVMVGYRNASYLLMERGQLKSGETAPLGFVLLLERVRENTSGLQLEEMVGPLSQAGSQVKERALRPLVKSRGSEKQSEELRRLSEAVRTARQQYWEILDNWLKAKGFPAVDEVILAGGTSHYYQKELEAVFPRTRCHWGDNLERQLVKLVGKSNWRSDWAYRLTDVYGYFFYLQHLWAGMRILEPKIP